MFPSRLMLSVTNSVCCGQCSLPLGRFILFKLQLNSEKRKLKNWRVFQTLFYFMKIVALLLLSVLTAEICSLFWNWGLTCLQISFALYSLVLRFALPKIACMQNVGSLFSQLFISSKIPTYIGPRAQIFSIFAGNLSNIIVIYQYLSIELQVCAVLVSI